MFLKRIVLQGFKSFADKTVIQFDHDITGIVGPNGCGKSNVNDAIRWVLGEQSVKSLRSGSSMSDIIFSGSEYRKPVNLARVTLVFDNSEHIFDSEFEEIEITRQIQRLNNEATYFINNTPCRLRDINDLVMDTGLGRDSLSIITQGNISSFADAKPEERRLLFEEAAGVAKYKKRKKVSLHKLEQTQANLDRVQDIIEEIQRQLTPLKRQADKAEKYTTLKNELSQIEISVLVEEIGSYNTKLSNLKKTLFDYQTNFTSQETSITQLDLEIDEIRKEVYRLDKQINELQQEYTRAMEESYQLEKRKIELDEKRKYVLSQADAKQHAKELAVLLAEAKYEYEDRKDRFDHEKLVLEKSTKELETYKMKQSRLEYETTQVNQVYQQLVNRKQVLENMSRQPYQHQMGVRSIMNAKKALQGIDGVVSDLLIAHKDRAKAIQAALSGSMYQIVTENEENARQAIRFLKKNRGGRATFLPLTVCKPRMANNNQIMIANNTQGFISWAYECTDCDEKYDSLNKRLLGNVAVVDTLENANEVAKRLDYRIKIVTLDGDVVHAGGSMTGGQGKNQTSPVTIRQELEEIDERIEKQKTLLEQNQGELNQVSEKIDILSQQCVDTQIQLARIENVYLVKKEKYDSLLVEYQDLNIDEMSSSEFQEDELVVQMSRMHARIDEITANLQTLRARRLNEGTKMEQKEAQIRTLRRESNSMQTQIHQLEIDKVKYSTQLENALLRLNSEYQMTYEYAQEKKQEIDLEVAKERVSVLHQEIHKLGNVNLDAPQEYQELKERYDFLETQKTDLENASQQILDAIAQMDETMISQFSEMFEKINNELEDVFRAMFGGGHAKLSLVDPEDILNSGVDIDVQPPGKLVKNIQTFSGGEKALIAISVLFAILKARTMPLCIFDEVEAALDQANVERFAKYISKFKGQSQFIVVTHRPGTMEQCDTLYGVTMQKDGVSQLLKVQLEDALNLTTEEEDHV